MVKGILADNNVIGQVAYLARLMQTQWRDFWKELGLVLRRFEGVGLAPTATDTEIWHRCQAEELILITDNRNDDTPDSLAAAIRTFGTPPRCPYSRSPISIGLSQVRSTRNGYSSACTTTFFASTKCAARVDCSCLDSRSVLRRQRNDWIAAERSPAAVVVDVQAVGGVVEGAAVDALVASFDD